MNLYLLTRKDDVGWDENEAFVIRAKSSRSARKIASEVNNGGENNNIWLDGTKTDCKVVRHNSSKEEIILCSFYNG